jgi:hypothetical protein
MPIPAVIPIVREEGYHTDQVGQYGSGQQFMAFVTATIPIPPPKDWQSRKRWYAVLHTFDTEGRHLKTETDFAGTTADGERAVIERAQASLSRMLGALGPVTYCDVRVRLFSVQVDGETFGLVDASVPEEEYESVHLLPNDLAFFDPWDGTYDT